MSSGGITGTPSALLAHWLLVSGYLLGPTARLDYADLAGLNLGGDDLAGAVLGNVNLTGTALAGAKPDRRRGVGDHGNPGIPPAALDAPERLPGRSHREPRRSVPVRSRSEGADLAGINLGNANLQDANLSRADLAGALLDDGYLHQADLASADLTGAYLHFATLTSANFSGANLSVADLYGATAAGATFRDAIWLHTTCPNGLSSDDYSAGCFSRQLYWLNPLITPTAGSTLPVSSRHVAVEFQLTNVAGHDISNRTGKALAAQHRVRATLSGPGIAPVSALCGWQRTFLGFRCSIRLPTGIKKGGKHQYDITVTENLGSGFVSVPTNTGASNPEIIHFA